MRNIKFHIGNICETRFKIFGIQTGIEVMNYLASQNLMLKKCALVCAYSIKLMKL